MTEDVDFNDPAVRDMIARYIEDPHPDCTHDEDTQCWCIWCPVRIERVANLVAKELFLRGDPRTVSEWDVRVGIRTAPEDRDELQRRLFWLWNGEEDD